MIVTCSRAACGLSTDMPDADWLAVRPLVWTAFVEEATFCSSECAAAWLLRKDQAPREMRL